MSQQATEALFKAVREIQPEAMIDAINAGANPYSRVPNPYGGPTLSALEAVTSDGVVRGVLGREGGLGEKMAQAVNHMMTVLPQNKEELQLIVNTHIETLGSEERAFQRFVGVEERATQMGGHLSAQAREHLWIERKGPNVLNSAFMDAPAWRFTVEQMNGMDLAQHSTLAKMAIEKGKELAVDDVRLYTLSHPTESLSGQPHVIDLERGELRAAQQLALRTNELSANCSFEAPKSFEQRSIARVKNAQQQPVDLEAQQARGTTYQNMK